MSDCLLKEERGIAAPLFIIWIEIILSTISIHLMNDSPKLDLQSQNMNITKIIFSALHLYAINRNYMQCLGLGNRAEASLFNVAKGNLHKSYRRELQHQLLKQFIIHSALQLFFDWPKAYSEFSKSAPVTSKLADYTVVISRSRVIMSVMTTVHDF